MTLRSAIQCSSLRRWYQAQHTCTQQQPGTSHSQPQAMKKRRSKPAMGFVIIHGKSSTKKCSLWSRPISAKDSSSPWALASEGRCSQEKDEGSSASDLTRLLVDIFLASNGVDKLFCSTLATCHGLVSVPASPTAKSSLRCRCSSPTRS